jgi:hypothetical protein
MMRRFKVTLQLIEVREASTPEEALLLMERQRIEKLGNMPGIIHIKTEELPDYPSRSQNPHSGGPRNSSRF